MALWPFAIWLFPQPGLLRILSELGAGADIVSGGELARAIAGGIAPARIVYSGVGKTEAELQAALRAGIHQINVESIAEIDQVATVASALCVVAPIAFRLNPDIAADTHDKIATGRKGDKFGIDHEQMMDAAKATRDVQTVAQAMGLTGIFFSSQGCNKEALEAH